MEIRAKSEDDDASQRLYAAAFVVGASLLALLIFVRPVTWLVLPAVGVMFPIWMVISHWLGWQSNAPPETVSGVLLRVLVTIVVAVVIAVSGRDPDEWFPVAPVIATVMLTFVVVQLTYAWRARVYVNDGSIGRLTPTAAAAHFTGYILGLAAGISAATFIATRFKLEDEWLWTGLAFGIAFALAKLFADLLMPEPARFRASTLSGTLLRMTVVSPLWWGLPWGIAFAGYSAFGFPISLSWESTLKEAASRTLHVAAAVTLVFAALTLVVYAQELFQRRQASAEGGEATAGETGDWVRMFAGVVCLSVAASLWVFDPVGPSERTLFGIETWTCAKDEDDYRLGWIADEGLHITNHRGAFDFFNMNCVPRDKFRGGCKYDKEGWEEVIFAVTGPAGVERVSFKRDGPDVHWGGLYGETALTLLNAFYVGSSTELTVKAPKGRLMYTRTIDLRGFRPALDQCLAHWRRNPPPKQR